MVGKQISKHGSLLVTQKLQLILIILHQAKILCTATNHAPGKAMHIDLKEGESSCFI
jgi:hypothetical protein